MRHISSRDIAVKVLNYLRLLKRNEIEPMITDDEQWIKHDNNGQ